MGMIAWGALIAGITVACTIDPTTGISILLVAAYFFGKLDQRDLVRSLQHELALAKALRAAGFRTSSDRTRKLVHTHYLDQDGLR